MLWNEKFAFGIKSVDEQHKELFRLMEETNRYIQEVRDGRDCYDEIDAILRELEAYTVYHFNDEESLMEKVSYKDLDKHIEEHNSFVAKVHEVLDGELDLHQENVLSDIYDFLLDWVSQHILFTDVHYVSTMKEKL
jgi:hemerythrin-like metal-binding protein